MVNAGTVTVSMHHTKKKWVSLRCTYGTWVGEINGSLGTFGGELHRWVQHPELQKLVSDEQKLHNG